MVDGKQLGSAGFKYLGVSYEKMDCQAFVERCLKDCGCNKDLPGSNSWYREVYKNGLICSPEDCVKMLGTVPAGAFLFIVSNDGGEPEKFQGDGLGNASHIGIVTGQGEGAIHSSYSRGCVAESKFQNKTIQNGGWNKVGLWNNVSYDYGPTPGPSPGPSPEPDPPEPDPPSPYPYEAIVSSGGNGPVNTRKGPGKNYAQSKAGKLAEGTLVEVQKEQDGWSYIRTVDKNGAAWYCWMDSSYLIPVVDPDPDPDPSTTLYTVTVRHLTYYEAEALKERYNGAVTIEEEV